MSATSSPCRLAAPALGVAACGDDDEAAAAAPAAAASEPLGHDPHRRLERRSSRSPRRRRAVQRGAPGREDHGRRSPAPAAASRSSAPARPTSPTPRARSRTTRRSPVCEKGGVKYGEVQIANDGIAVVDEQGPEGRLPDHRPAQEAVEQGLEGQEPVSEVDRSCPTPQLSLYGPGTDSGTFDFFTDEINGEEGVTREDYEASEDDNQLVTGVTGDRGRPRLLRLLLLRGATPDKLNLVSVDAGERLRQAVQGDDPGRLLQAALAPAVHVPVGEGDGPPRGQGVHGLRGQQPGRHRRRREDRADDRRAGQADALDKAEARWPSSPWPSRDHAAAAGAQGAGRSPRTPAVVAARRDQGRAPRRRAVGRDHDPDRRLAPARDDRLLRRRPLIGDFLFGTKWTPLLSRRAAVLRRPPARLGHAVPDRDRASRRGAARAAHAIYLAEYAPPRVRKVVKPVLEVLAGVPTIVFGYFALTFFTPRSCAASSTSRSTSSTRCRPGSSWACSSCRRSPRSPRTRCRRCPQSLREGAFGLGANKLQVSIRVVFPAALSGIVAALVLGASRAVGETVIVLIAGGQRRTSASNPTRATSRWRRSSRRTARGDIPTGSIEYETIFVVGFTLFVADAAPQRVSIRLVRKYRQVYE